MPSPDRTPKFVAFLFAVFVLGVLTPIVGVAAADLIVAWLDLGAPWSSVVISVTSIAAAVLGATASLRLDDLRRRRG
jgi:hypothetical protein